MKSSSQQKSNNVVSLNSAEAAKASDRKWSKPVMARGFCIVPSLLLRAQQRVGLNATQLCFILHLLEYWWDGSRNPYPSRETLAQRMGLSARQISRCIKELNDAGLVKRVPRHKPGKGQTSNEYDLSGLVQKLKSLEPEFRVADEARREVGRRGGLKRAAA